MPIYDGETFSIRLRNDLTKHFDEMTARKRLIQRMEGEELIQKSIGK